MKSVKKTRVNNKIHIPSQNNLERSNIFDNMHSIIYIKATPSYLYSSDMEQSRLRKKRNR